MLWSETVDVRAAAKIDDVLVTRILFRRDGPNEMAVECALRDEVFPVQTFRRFRVSPFAAFNALAHAIDSSLHAHESQENVYRLALDAGHASSPVPRGNRITFAVCDRRDFVSGFRSENYERAGLCRHAKAIAQIAEYKRPATISVRLRRLGFTTQKYYCRDAASFRVESHQTGVSILMRHEEIPTR